MRGLWIVVCCLVALGCLGLSALPAHAGGVAVVAQGAHCAVGAQALVAAQSVAVAPAAVATVTPLAVVAPLAVQHVAVQHVQPVLVQSQAVAVQAQAHVASVAVAPLIVQSQAVAVQAHHCAGQQRVGLLGRLLGRR